MTALKAVFSTGRVYNPPRKFAATRNGSMMYRVEAVLKAIEDGEAMPNAGIVDRGEMADVAENNPNQN